MIRFKHGGDFKNIEKLLTADRSQAHRTILNNYGRRGVNALIVMTPVDSGITAESWGYFISSRGGNYTINWTNSHVSGDVPIAILIQYGHATRSGGYVQGTDFINPAMKGVFQNLADDLYKEVTN